PSNPSQKVPVVPLVESTSSTRGTYSTESTLYGNPKTLFKTHDDDDIGNRANLTEIGAFLEPLVEVVNSLYGDAAPGGEQECERWRECGELLAAELQRAAARAEPISSVPAFFAAHLRRRLRVTTTAKAEPRPDRELTKQQASKISNEQRLRKLLHEIRQLHVGDAAYGQSELLEDLRYRCEREGIAWDEDLVNKLIRPEGRE